MWISFVRVFEGEGGKGEGEAEPGVARTTDVG